MATKLFGEGGGARYGYNQALRNAIFTYHRARNSDEAAKYLVGALRNFKDHTRKAECEETLRGYLRWAESSRNVVASWRVRLNLVLHRDILLGGEISRVEIDPENDHYLAVILGDRPLDWRNQLKMPLIQYEIASQFHRLSEQVRVGYQELDGSNLETFAFGRRAIEEALDEGRKVGRAVHQEVVKQTGDL